MADQELVVSKKNGLIKQTDVELALAKIDKFKSDGLTHQQRSKFKKAEDRFSPAFIGLCADIFGVSLNQLKKLSDKDLVALDKVLSQSRRIKSWSWVNKASMFLALPALIYAMDRADYPVSYFRSWHYLSSRKKLKSAYGENYFPIKACRKAIRKLIGYYSEEDEE